MAVEEFPGPDIKRFEVTIKTHGFLKKTVSIRVSRDWVDGKSVGDAVQALTTDNEAISGDIIAIRPLREGI